MYYVDDVIFAKADNGSNTAITEGLQELQNYTSLSVRIMKSNIYINGNCGNTKEFFDAYGFLKDTLPSVGMHLGLPLSHKSTNRADSDSLLVSPKSLVDKWKTKVLSSVGKLQSLKWGVHSKLLF